MAEVLFKEALSKRGLSDDWIVASAATWGPSGHPTTIEARTVAAEHDLDLENHGSGFRLIKFFLNQPNPAVDLLVIDFECGNHLG